MLSRAAVIQLAFCIFLGIRAALGYAQADGIAELRTGFKDPPADSRIMMRWWWFGPAVDNAELERELQAMKQAGIGGVEVQPVYPLALDNPTTGFHNFPYLSDQFLEALRFTADKARELGLRFDITLGSGWPFGGPHIPITQAAGQLRMVSASIPAGANSLAVPDISAGEKLLGAFVAKPSQPASLPEMLNLSAIQNGRLTLRVPGNPQTIMWFIASRSGMMVKRPAIGAEGFVLDHFDRAAIENHLHAVGDRLLSAFADHPPYAVFSDSLEVYGSDWTSDLLEEFQKRRDYDLTPYLPALVQDTGPQTSDIRHDWGQTLTELIDERYLTPIYEWAARHRTQFRSQTYGIPAVTLSSNNLADLPEGEGENWQGFSAARWASSASHLYGRNITSAETWTWLHSPAFRATPLDMKADADLFFLQGINQIIGHGWPYSPPEISEPGWRFYAAGAFNDHNPWWPVMPEVTRYLQRISYLLRQGKPVNDVALFVPTDDAWAQFSPGNDSVSESTEQLLGPNVIPEILNSGLNFDFIDNRAIDQNGTPYPVLILPGVERLPLAIYHRIEHYVQEGGVVIATRNLPSRAPGLRQARTDTAEIRQISRELFQNPGAKGYFVADERQLGELLNHHFTPDLSTAPKIPELGFAHRKLPFADIYFLANTSNRSVSTTAKFRTQATYAEWWDPFSGEVSPAASSSTIDLKLEPYESRLLVFMNQAHSFAARSTTARGREKVASTIDLGKDWTVTFPELNRTIHMNELRSWTDDEETRFYSGRAVYEKNFAVPARAGKRIYLDFGPGTIVQQYSHSHFRVWLDGPVRESAQVIINDRPAGSIWKPPYKLDVTELLRNGENHLRIVVYNLAINSLAGRALPDYRLLNSRYGERFVPQGMEHLEALPSGLLGAPRLVIAEAP